MFLQAIFCSTLVFLQEIVVFLQFMGVFLQPIFCGTLAFLQQIAVFLQLMGVFLPPIFCSTLAFLELIRNLADAVYLLNDGIYQGLGVEAFGHHNICGRFARHNLDVELLKPRSY